MRWADALCAMDWCDDGLGPGRCRNEFCELGVVGRHTCYLLPCLQGAGASLLGFCFLFVAACSVSLGLRPKL